MKRLLGEGVEPRRTLGRASTWAKKSRLAGKNKDLQRSSTDGGSFTPQRKNLSRTDRRRSGRFTRSPRRCKTDKALADRVKSPRIAPSPDVKTPSNC